MMCQRCRATFGVRATRERMYEVRPWARKYGEGNLAWQDALWICDTCLNGIRRYLNNEVRLVPGGDCPAGFGNRADMPGERQPDDG